MIAAWAGPSPGSSSTRAGLGKGPAWDAASGTLLWVDVLAGRVHRYDPATGADTAFSVGQPVSVAVPRAGDPP